MTTKQAQDRMRQIVSLINECSDEECHLVFEAAKRRRSALATMQVATFYVGQRVSFKNRAGVAQSGTIEKINIKTATVAVPHKVGDYESKRLWRVSPSLLRAVSS